MFQKEVFARPTPYESLSHLAANERISSAVALPAFERLINLPSTATLMPSPLATVIATLWYSPSFMAGAISVPPSASWPGWLISAQTLSVPAGKHSLRQI